MSPNIKNKAATFIMLATAASILLGVGARVESKASNADVAVLKERVSAGEAYRIRDKEQLDRMEQKIDKISEKLDRRK